MTAADPRDITLVVATADNGVIGLDGKMPWHLPADLRHFKRITMGHPIVMGRKTFAAIGRPLPGRHNIVLTRSPAWQAEGVSVAADLPAALAMADASALPGPVMVIGGGEIYAQARPIATRIELTKIHLAPAGDAFFPAPEPGLWREVSREDHATDGDAPAHSFLSFVRINR